MDSVWILDSLSTLIEDLAPILILDLVSSLILDLVSILILALASVSTLMYDLVSILIFYLVSVFRFCFRFLIRSQEGFLAEALAASSGLNDALISKGTSQKATNGVNRSCALISHDMNAYAPPSKP